MGGGGVGGLGGGWGTPREEQAEESLTPMMLGLWEKEVEQLQWVKSADDCTVLVGQVVQLSRTGE